MIAGIVRSQADRIFIMGAMIGELRENGMTEDQIRVAIDAAFKAASHL